MPTKQPRLVMKADRRAAIIALARQFETEGELELDDDARVKISEGEANGAYVLMWRWVDFNDTPLCKEDPSGPDSDIGCSPECSHHAKAEGRP